MAFDFILASVEVVDFIDTLAESVFFKSDIYYELFVRSVMEGI